MNQVDNSPKGLPRYFIGIGIGLILLPLVFMAVTKFMYDDVRGHFGDRNMEIMEVMFSTCVILGLTMIALTRSKVETEATKTARITGFVGGFMTGIVLVLLTPLFALFGLVSDTPMSNTQLIISMLIMSFVFRYTLRKSVEKQ